MQIRLENVSKSYDRPVLKNLNYCFESGRLYVLKGVSGSGKSTLLNIIGGVEKDFKGSVVYEPQNPCSAYIYQQSLLLSRLTVRENLQLVCRNTELVEEYAEVFGIEDLLDKLPETLSGGERQRVSTERALLKEPQVLLVDEPTASLDDQNSRKIAKMIAGLKREDRILIAATHEEYFDRYADHIIELDYGMMKTGDSPKAEENYQPVAKNDEPDDKNENSQNAACKPALSGRSSRIPQKMLSGLRYVIKRQPGLLKPVKLLLTAIFFLMIFLGSALQKNVTAEAVRLYREDRPVDLVKLQSSVVSQLPEETRSRLTIYDDYYAEDGEITAYYLLPKEHSVLARPGAVSHGHFPEKDTEVLVNISLAGVLSSNPSQPEKCLGKHFTFCGLDLQVSGIVSSYQGDFRCDWYYAYGKDHHPLSIEDQHVFIAYPLLKEIGTKSEGYMGIIMASSPGLWDDEDLQDRLRYDETDYLNNYLQYIRELQEQAGFYVRIAFVVMLVLFAIACLYMVSVIRLELFYRKRELGYLQIFGLPKGRVHRLILLEYVVKLLASLLLSGFVYIILAGIYAAVTGGSIPLPDPAQTCIMISVLALLYLLTVWLSEAFFLRKSIVRLIT